MEEGGRLLQSLLAGGYGLARMVVLLTNSFRKWNVSKMKTGPTTAVTWIKISMRPDSGRIGACNIVGEPEVDQSNTQAFQREEPHFIPLFYLGRLKS
jgi:hypothetical protein